MVRAERSRIAIVAGLSQSLVNFRGPLIEALLAEGHDVFAIGPEADDQTLQWLMARGVPFHPIPLARTGISPREDLATLRALVATFKSIRADVVIAYTIKPVIYGMIAARFAGVHRRYAMITGLGYAFTQGANSLKRRLISLAALTLYKTGLSQADCVLFQNPDDQAEFQRLGLVPAEKKTGIVNGSGVDVDRFAPCALPETPIFLMIARLVADKGLVEFIHAARELRAQRPEARCVLVGPRDSNPAAIPAGLVEQAVEAGAIDWRGAMQDIRPAIREASVYVLPSYREGTPRSTLEAMAMGRPVITTDVPGCRETVRDGLNGLLVPVRDAQALAQAMIRLCDDREARIRMGAASLAMVREKYDARTVAGTVLDHFGLRASASNAPRHTTGEII